MKIDRNRKHLRISLSNAETAQVSGTCFQGIIAHETCPKPWGERQEMTDNRFEVSNNIDETAS